MTLCGRGAYSNKHTISKRLYYYVGAGKEKEEIYMLKATLIAGFLSAMALGVTAVGAGNAKSLPERDARIIVELERDKDSLTEEGIANTHSIVLNNIKNYATSNIRLLSSYSKTVNAIAISLNSNDIEAVKKVPGVKSVTLDEIHWVQSLDEPHADDEGIDEDEIDIDYGGSENQSATTMKKPTDTYDGEGTTIAILDNEFYFKANSAKGAGDAWNHETYSRLDENEVGLKHTSRPTGATKTIAWKYVTAQGKQGANLGVEGSLYYNNKVPFYFDYGGETTSRTENYNQDFDVSSEIAYHGSHVASIASGNAPEYKGIAPKAQLICMKVFTNYKPALGSVDRILGYSASSGAYDIPIMNALEDCITLGVDGINMSLGSDLNDFDKESVTLQVLNKLANSGILTSISAGNSGKASFSSLGAYSNWTRDMVETGILSSYANSATTTTLASGQPGKIFYKSAFEMRGTGDNSIDFVAYDDQIVNRENYDAEYSKEFKMKDLLNGDPETELEWVYVPGFGATNDYKGLQVSGKIAVVNRGSTSFADKYNVAKQQRAKALIIINNDPTSNDFNFRCSFGDGFKPTMPCALVLFKDKAKFETQRTGTFKIIANKIASNPEAYSISSFSSDGATYDLDLKPDITAPGENIRGAVPPQTKADKKYRKLTSYEFLSGTSMSAPNYAGAQSVVLSKKAGKIYHDALVDGTSVKASQLNEIKNFRNTVDMRLMSTAEPMYDVQNSPENDEKVLTSPRRQGAGMVNLGAAYTTDTYLEGIAGYDENQKALGSKKSKIALGNNEDINKGDIKLSFLAHNESEDAKEYSVKLTVLRPAIVKGNDIVTKEYNHRGEIEKIDALPGAVYWINESLHPESEDPDERMQPAKKVAEGEAEHNDVLKITRQILYYASEEDLRADNPTTLEVGNYYNEGTKDNIKWAPLPSKDFQSVQDVLIDEYEFPAKVTIAAGDSVVNLPTYSLKAEDKAEILKLYKYGCFIEGYVILTRDNDCTLSMPYMGFFAGEGHTYENAPIVEPFAFEKDPNEVYPSDLVNDIAKQLVGKDKANMGSLWVAGYVKPGDRINTDKVLSNDDNFANLSGFYQLGADASGAFLPDASNNLTVGATHYSNTMIIQQFVLRSVANNYFTIKNKVTGEEVYRSVLEDMLFGDSMGEYQLYKSHVDAGYLSAGYVAHRAYAVVPLYNEETGKSFPTGQYEVTFNYKLAATGNWVAQSYNLNIDSDAPEVQSVDVKGDNFQIRINEANLVSATVGKYTSEFKKDDAGYYIELTKEQVLAHLNENKNAVIGSGRLFVGLTDAAHGYNGAIIRFNQDGNGQYIFNSFDYVIVQHQDLTFTYDFFVDEDNNLKVVKYDSAKATQAEVVLEGLVLVSYGPVSDEDKDVTVEVVANSCGGNIAATSVLLSAIAGLSFALVLIAKKKRKLGGNL